MFSEPSNPARGVNFPARKYETPGGFGLNGWCDPLPAAGLPAGQVGRMGKDRLGGCRSRLLSLVDDALNRLTSVDFWKARVVELRYFGGLSVEQTMDVMGLSDHTMRRDWEFAKAWLAEELSR